MKAQSDKTSIQQPYRIDSALAIIKIRRKPRLAMNRLGIKQTRVSHQ
jgi:hypothetical protein